MQTMNTDQQPYYPNQTVPAGYYAPNGPEQHFSMRNPNIYTQHMQMPAQYYTNNLGQTTLVFPQFLPNQSFVPQNNPRAMNPTAIPIIRPPNETSNAPQNYNPQPQYSTYPQYPPQQFPPYQGGPVYSPSSQQQYPSQPLTQSSQTSQQSSHDHVQSSQPLQTPEKRQRKPLAIIDPKSHVAIKVETTTSPTTTEDSTTDSTTSNSKSTDDAKKNQKQADFRKDFARILNPNVQTDKDATKENQTDDSLQPSRSSSRSSSISKTSSEQIHPVDVPEIITEDKSNQEESHPFDVPELITEDKSNQEQDHPVDVPEIITEDKSNQEQNPTEDTSNQEQNPTEDTSNQDQNPIEDKLNQDQSSTELESTGSKSPSDDASYEGNIEISPLESLKKVTSTPINSVESEPITLGKTPSGSKRHGYTIEELRQKKESILSRERPSKLIKILGVTVPDTPPQPVKSEMDSDEKFIRDVTAILNKLTPQNNDKLVEKLDKLELNSAKRLEGMITVMFIKAVEAAIFCSLYAKLCKHFQKKQVTVPNETGQPVTYFFRQILLTRCQKEFEGDYRQNIKYEERHIEVEAIADEKVRKEAAEQLEEDLLKAKRKKLGNIIFIGELFKLQMLTDTIMYDCVEYLLRDKTDEESLECLCKLLTNIGKELDAKANEKASNRKNMEKNYGELFNISTQRQTSARIRFMIQDLMDMKKANWVARRAEMKPTTIDEIHETERLKREQQEIDRDRERQQRREHNRSGGGGGGGPQHYTESRGSRGSGMKQQSNRTEEDRGDNRFLATIKQYQLNDKRNQEASPLSFAPPRAWGKGSGVEKKSEDDRSNTGRTNKPPASGNSPFRSKTGANPGYPGQRQPSRELGRENSQRDRENAKESLRKTTSAIGPSNPKNTNSRESSRDISREESRNVSPDSTKISTTINNPNIPFDETKTQASVHSLIEEYAENYSDNTDRPVNEAIEDLSSFCTANLNQQAVVVRELFTNVLEGKPRARKAVGHLLDVALHKEILSTEGFLSGINMLIEVIPDYAVDIPLIWQYVGEILGAFIGAPSSNMVLLKPILQLIPEMKSKQLFQDIIQYAKEFSSENQIQRFWQSTGFSLNDLLKVDSSFISKYNWLTDPIEPETTTTTTTIDNQTPVADPQLVKLFKSIDDQGTTVTSDQILSYIRENMNSTDKYYIRNIVLSYLEACLVNRESQKKIQEDIAKQRQTVLIAIIESKPEAEVQAVYAIQNFVHKLEHPPKMAQLLFDIFYDEECISEESFLEWLRNPDQSETDGHSIVAMSTKEFFNWLQQSEPEAEEEEGGGEEES